MSAHTNAPKSTAIVVTLSQKGAVVTALTDSTLEHSGSGSGADILFTASSEWDAPVGVYDVSAQVYNGSSVVKEEKSKLTVVAFTPRSPIGIPGGSLDPDPTASPSPSASPSASASASPSASATPDSTPTATATADPDQPDPPNVTPTPDPPKVTPTPEPPPPPLGGNVTRSNESNDAWTNTFTVSGFRPQGAQVFVAIKLHQTGVTPHYYAPAKYYPCGNATLYSGSGASATYQCSVTLTIEPPGDWRAGEYWYTLEGNTYGSKVVSGGRQFSARWKLEYLATPLPLGSRARLHGARQRRNIGSREPVGHGSLVRVECGIGKARTYPPRMRTPATPRRSRRSNVQCQAPPGCVRP